MTEDKRPLTANSQKEPVENYENSPQDVEVTDMQSLQAERRKRAAAANFARASVELEGFKISELSEQLTQKYINCEIELADALKALATQMSSKA